MSYENSNKTRGTHFKKASNKYPLPGPGPGPGREEIAYTYPC